MANATSNARVDAAARTLTDEKEQRSRAVMEAAVMADADTLEWVRDALVSEAAYPHMGLDVYTHDGGLENTTPAATYANTDGDTITFQFFDPDAADDDRVIGSAADLGQPDRLFTEVVHTLAGVTAGAATPAQIAASLNGDAEFSKWAYAAAGAISANGVAVFPRGLRGQARVTGVSAAAGIVYPGTTVKNAERTFTRVGPLMGGSGWDVSYAAATKTVVVTNNTGGPVSRVAAVIHNL